MDLPCRQKRSFCVSMSGMNKLIPDAEEARLLGLLKNEWWQKNASVPHLKQMKVDEARLMPSGIIVRISLQPSMTQERIIPLLPYVRRMLDIRDQHTARFRKGGRASQLALLIHTRRVTDTMDMLWRPGITSLGVDTVTGDEVHVSTNSRLLYAGSSGSGKSWSMRPLMLSLLGDETKKPALIDGKGDEANKWSGLMDIYRRRDDIINVIEVHHDEMKARDALMEKKGLSEWNVDLGPEKILIVDEGRVILSLIGRHDKMLRRPEEGEEPEIPLLEKLLDLSSLGRSRGIPLWWATQFPIVSGPNRGIDNNIKANLDTVFCLRVKNRTQADVALDDDASYGPHLIPFYDPKRAGPDDYDTRGHGYLSGYGPNLIRSWTVTDEILEAQKNLPIVERETIVLSPPPSRPSSPPLVDILEEEMSLEDIVSKSGRTRQEVLEELTRLTSSGEVTCRLTQNGFLYRKLVEE